MIPWYFEGTRDKYRESVKPLKFLRKTNVLAHEALREVPTLSSKTLKTLRKSMILQEMCTTFLEREYALLSETLIKPYETEGFGARSAPFFSVLGTRTCGKP